MQKKNFPPEVRFQALKKLKEEEDNNHTLFTTFLKPSRLKTKKAHKHKH